MSDVPPGLEGLDKPISEMSGDEIVALLGGMAPEEQAEIPPNFFPGLDPTIISQDGPDTFTVPAPPDGKADPVFRDGLLVHPLGRREIKWTEEDVWGPFIRGGEEITRAQEQLIDAGLLARGGFEEGMWDEPSRIAMRQLLGFANVSGRDPNELLVHLASTTEEKKQRLRSEAVRRATAGFVRDDPATARSTVKSAVRDLIRRDPTDQEMAEITAHWRQFEQQDLGQQQAMAADQAEFEAGFTDVPPSATDVDPEARLEEFLAQRFAGTITQNQRVDEMQNGQHNLLRMIDRTAGLMSGG